MFLRLKKSEVKIVLKNFIVYNDKQFNKVAKTVCSDNMA